MSRRSGRSASIGPTPYASTALWSVAVGLAGRMKPPRTKYRHGWSSPAWFALSRFMPESPGYGRCTVRWTRWDSKKSTAPRSLQASPGTSWPGSMIGTRRASLPRPRTGSRACPGKIESASASPPMAIFSYSRVRFRNRWSGGSWSWRSPRHPGWILRRGPHGYEAATDGGADEVKRVEMIRETMERSEEHTYELQSLMRISYAVFCLKKKKKELKHMT